MKRGAAFRSRSTFAHARAHLNLLSAGDTSEPDLEHAATRMLMALEVFLTKIKIKRLPTRKLRLMETPKGDQAFYECPRFQRCSANDCPLDIQMGKRGPVLKCDGPPRFETQPWNFADYSTMSRTRSLERGLLNLDVVHEL